MRRNAKRAVNAMNTNKTADKENTKVSGVGGEVDEGEVCVGDEVWVGARADGVEEAVFVGTVVCVGVNVEVAVDSWDDVGVGVKVVVGVGLGEGESVGVGVGVGLGVGAGFCVKLAVIVPGPLIFAVEDMELELSKVIELLSTVHPENE
jgi:hypothetical protein